MKAYGTKKRDTPGRNKRGTSSPCSCCTPNKFHWKIKAFKKNARRNNKNECLISEEVG
jgi:hypothetical protein